MSRHDETLEAIAAIRMAVDNDDSARAHQLSISSVAKDPDFQPAIDQGDSNIKSPSGHHWTLGSPDRLMHLEQLAESYKFPAFETAIRHLLSTVAPEEFSGFGACSIKVCKTLPLCCQS